MLKRVVCAAKKGVDVFIVMPASDQRWKMAQRNGQSGVGKPQAAKEPKKVSMP